MKEIKEQIIKYITSGFPLIAIQTREYERAIKIVIESIQEIEQRILPNSENAPEKLKTMGYTILEWNCISGLSYPSGENIEGTEEPEAQLKYLITELGDNPTIVIATNLHMFWSADYGFSYLVPKLVELFRQFYEHGAVSAKYLILIGDTTFPPEIRSYFAVIDMPLPDRDTIKDIVVNFYSEVIGKKPKNEEIIDVVNACSGMDSREIENALYISTKRKGKSLIIDREKLYEEKAKIVRKSGLLEWIKVEETLDDIGGLDNMKKWFMKVAKAFKNPEKAQAYGLPIMKGALIIGVSGTGKSLTAKAISNLFEVPLFRFDVGRIFGSLVGETERNTREAFKLIDAVSPCVVLIDEIEKALSGIEGSGFTDSGVTARFIGSFLYYLQEKKSQSFFVCTANNIAKLPPELMRKGRFDEMWYVGLPTMEEIKQIIKIHIRKVGRDPEKYDIEKIAKNMLSFTGAEVETCIKQAMYQAFFEDREFTTEDIIEVASNTIPIAQTRKEEIQALENWAKFRARFATSEPKSTQKKRKRAIIGERWDN